jgi:single-strand DNA-binding protein
LCINDLKAKGKKIVSKYSRLQTAISASKGLNTDYRFFTTPSLFCQSDTGLAEITNFKTVPQRDTKLTTMYALKNKVQLIGNLGGKPEIKEMESGKKLATFNVATNESYRNAKGEKVTETQWHRVVAWGKVAEIAEKYLDKGKEVALEGKLINRSYNDKDGNKRYITEIQVNELLLLGAKVVTE